MLVVGDLILDRYWYGTTERVSPEAPVPVVLVDDVAERAGGAANVAANIAALDGHVMLVGRTGEDDAAAALRQLCDEHGIATDFVADSAHPTLVKLRVVSQRQQLLRIDFERIMQTGADAIVERARRHLDDTDVVVVSDYAKGALAAVGSLIDAANAAGKPVLVDPKGRDFERYRGATVVTPNQAEFEAVVGACADDEELERKARLLIDQCGIGAILVTRGAAGMTLVPRAQPARHVAADAQEVFDVTGAGDTVCGVMAAALATGLDLGDAMRLANAAAGVVVSRFGAATVTRDELGRALSAATPAVTGVVEGAQLRRQVAAARQRGEHVVMTNGCFDLLHAGHVKYLREAREMGDRLIVAVNDDASVARLKGPSRPVNSLAARMQVLAELKCVDWVVPFAEDTPRQLIASVLPDLLVKGGDYRVEQIAGAQEVLAAGGDVRVLPFHDGYSTSAMIEKMNGAEAERT